MEIGQKIKLKSIESLGLGPLDVDLGESGTTRNIKLWMVPEAVSEDKYFISVTEPGAIEELPPCKIKDAILLVHYRLDGEGSVDIKFIKEEVRNA